MATPAPRALFWFALFAALALGVLQEPEEIVISRGFHHLGDTETPEWPEAAAAPQGKKLEITFVVRARNREEQTLQLTQRHVSERWSVQINGSEIAALKRDEGQKTCYYPVPAELLRKGENTLLISAGDTSDDITVGDIKLLERPFREFMKIGVVEVRVRDGDGRAWPVRLTVVDQDGKLAPNWYGEGAKTAVRDGVIYSADGDASFGLVEGDYTVYASRGVEWSAPRAPLELRAGRTARLRLAIAREVDTGGYVAADTHVHTLTYSGHGDASIEERVLTLAAEGVELAVATDHNHQTDYRPHQQQAGLQDHYTSVTGNEVTTELGHFNAFPLAPGGPLPDHQIADWVKLMEEIRAKGAQVVILNHPRWPDFERGPYGVFDLNRVSGERHAGPAFTFDAMEIFNSTAPETHPDELLHDWFVLLNHGERISGIGSSDSHTVLDMVGQGRTYVPSSAEPPGEIAVDEACQGFLQGATSCSLGIYAEARKDGRPAMGRTFAAAGAFTFQLRVATPSWAAAETASIYLNGQLAQEIAVPAAPGQPGDHTLEVSVALPGHDAWLACVVRGPKPAEPFWYCLMPYSAAATNPIFLDVDGDGAYSSPRDTARKLLDRVGSDPALLSTALASCDAAVAVQAASLLRQQLLERARQTLGQFVESQGPHTPALEAFLQELPEKDFLLPSPPR